jgi:hypothetical protein
MHQVSVVGSLVSWHRLVLLLGVVVVAWGPAHPVEVTASAHGVEDSASHAEAVPDRDRLGVPVEDGRDGHRCGHRDVERDATQATPVRLRQPSVLPGLAATQSGDGEPRPVMVDHSGPRAPPGPAVLVNVCVWRQ